MSCIEINKEDVEKQEKEEKEKKEEKEEKREKEDDDEWEEIDNVDSENRDNEIDIDENLLDDYEIVENYVDNEINKNKDNE